MLLLFMRILGLLIINLFTYLLLAHVEASWAAPPLRISRQLPYCQVLTTYNGTTLYDCRTILEYIASELSEISYCHSHPLAYAACVVSSLLSPQHANIPASSLIWRYFVRSDYRRQLSCVTFRPVVQTYSTGIQTCFGAALPPHRGSYPQSDPEKKFFFSVTEFYFIGLHVTRSKIVKLKVFRANQACSKIFTSD